ncbi:transglutaminaseTgpA domain-containing protein [Nocardioides taihuensis]|uniref:TransglutaminaseTgpA domain-containing protein n=1 Tax=Nocardioides taihuensis TaxID=1835606 RepID=A0ABW0BNW1_9ACTN
MNPVRGGLPATLALAATGAATTWVAMLSWRGFADRSAHFLGPLLVLAVVVGLTGALSRWARLSPAVAVPGQVLLSGAVASMMLCGSPLPVGPAWDRLVAAFADAVTSAQQYKAPIPAFAPPIDPLLIVGGLACLLLVDIIAGTLRRAPLAGLPLLAVYTVPVSLDVDGPSWWVFALTAGGFLTLIFLQENEAVARWGRPLGSDASSDPFGFGVRTGAVRATAGAVGGAATALAIVLPLAIPTLSLGWLPGGDGPGGDGVTIENPMVDLRRDLQRGDDIPLLRIRTDDPDPSYLRIAALPRYNGETWSTGNLDLPPEHRANGTLPEVLGVASTVPRVTHRYEVTTTDDFDSQFLPTEFPVTEISAEGDWRYDTPTMNVMSYNTDVTAAGMSYTMTGVDFDYSAADMSRAPATGGLVGSEYTYIPSGVSSDVSSLAFQVTRNEDSRFEQATALQQWFRKDGGFRYSLNATEGNGTDDLVRFLSTGEGGRTGYCEQFAAAMAIMARTLGIPSRVAVGFFQPDQVGTDTFEYSAHDLHAWPELFFPGSGWVRFEPTPAGRPGSPQAPAYTTQQVQDIPEGNLTANPRISDDVPDRGESESASAAPDKGRDENAQQEGTPFPWVPVLTVGGLLLVMAGLLLLPRTVRRSRRRRRLVPDPEVAWAEIRDTAVDLRVPWRAARSPRETRDHLARYLGHPLSDRTPERPARGPDVSPAAAAALDRLAHALELSRYAREGGAYARGADDALVADLQTVLDSLVGGAPRRARRAAEWWPRSVLSRRTPAGPRAMSPEPVGAGGVVDHVG